MIAVLSSFSSLSTINSINNLLAETYPVQQNTACTFNITQLNPKKIFYSQRHYWMDNLLKSTVKVAIPH